MKRYRVQQDRTHVQSPRHFATKRSAHVLPQRFLPKAIAMSLALSPAPLLAGAVTDSSWGRVPQALSGDFTVPESMGKPAGGNLFHSFKSFSINAGESATFTTTFPFQNVISRVSGAEASTINGLLRLQAAAGTPNFFFINPNGVTFGAGAQINVPASFYVSTANNLRFADETVYSAGIGPDDTFTTAAPEAFGFLDGRPRAITLLTEANLNCSWDERCAEPNDFYVIGGDITMSDAKIVLSEGGSAYIYSIGGPGEVPLGTSDLNATTKAQFGATQFGDIAMTSPSGTQLNALSVRGKNGGGRVVIVGHDLTMDDALISAKNSSDTIPQQNNIDIWLTGTLEMTGSGIYSETDGTNAAGSISIRASSMSLYGNSAISVDSRSSTAAAGSVALDVAGQLVISDQLADSQTEVTANGYAGGGGNIKITAGSFRLLNGAYMATTTFGGTDTSPSSGAGDIKIDAGRIELSGTSTSGSRTSIYANTESTGHGGKVTLTSGGDLLVTDGAEIQVPASESGDAGGLTLTARDLLLIGSKARLVAGAIIARGGDIHLEGARVIVRDQAYITSTVEGDKQGGSVSLHGTDYVEISNSAAIETDTYSGWGAAGNITVSASKGISIADDVSIASDTYGRGSAGTIQISAGSTTLNRSLVSSTAQPGSTGQAGSIVLAANRDISVTDSVIATDTHGLGAAGSIEISAKRLIVDPSEISSAASRRSGGQVGSIRLELGESLSLVQGSRISIQNESTVQDLSAITPATLSVTAPSILLDGGQITASSTGKVDASNIALSFRNSLRMRDAAVTTTAHEGNGGAIEISGGQTMWLTNSQILTSVLGLAGNGGNIDVNADSLILDTGFIQANTAARNAAGGNVMIDTRTLIPSANTLFVGGATPILFQSGVNGLNVIQAAAPDGVSGAIQVTNPQIDLAGSLSNVEADIVDASALSRDLCRVGAGSSLTPVGRGGLAPSGMDALRPEARSPTKANMQGNAAPVIPKLSCL